MLELLPGTWHDLDFRALLLTVLTGRFLICPSAAGFCRRAMGLLASVLPRKWFCEGVGIL